MVNKMSMKTRKELTYEFRRRYRLASKKDKTIILDGFISVSGYNRKYAIGLIGSKKKVSSSKKKQLTRHRKPKYDVNTRNAFVKIWLLTSMMNSKALHAILPIMLDKLILFNEIEVDEYTYNQLLTMSISTMERIIKPTRDKMQLRGKTTTKPSALLKTSIKIRKAGDEVEQMPGFVEVDTVAHCGNTQKGEFIRSVTVTDVYTRWTIDRAIMNIATKHIIEALDFIESCFPFPITGFDSDNGSEFINHDVVRWVGNRNLYMTRSRPYKKNDNARVEKRNYDFVRRNAFYYRYETKEELSLLNELYQLVSLKYNFITPTQKSIGYTETKLGKRKTIRDKFATPYERVKRSNILPVDKTKELETLFNSINPAELTRNINNIQNKLIKLASNKPESRNYVGK
jgi:transposase InsO family protein